MEWVNIIIQGVLIGGLYAMFAAGLALIFGVMRLVNIAHGDLIVLAAYVALMTTDTLGLNPLLAIVIVVPIMAAIGYALQRALLNRTLGDDVLPPLLVTFGLSVIIQNALLEIFTADSRRLKAGAIEVASFPLAEGVWIGVLPLLQFVVAVAVIAGLQLLFYRTAFGRALPGDFGRSVGRATDGPRQPPRLRACHGAVPRCHRGRRCLSGRAHQFRPGDRARPPDLRLRGRHHRWAGQHVGNAGRWDHPRRLAGDRCADQSRLAASGRASRLSSHPGDTSGGPVSEGAGMSASFRVEHATRSSHIGTAVFAVALIALAAAPAWGGRDDLRLLSEIYAYVALASLWNLLAGYAGLVSVGQQAYVGLGGYVLFASTILAGVHPLVAVPVAGVIAAVVALPVAGLMFRLRGHYFAIGTWVVAEVFRLISSQISALGGGSGISLPAGIVTAMASSRQMREFLIYWVALALVVIVLAAIVLLLRSRYGLALTAIRDNELAARSNGVDVTRTKLVVYVLTAFGTAMIGALIFLQKLRISPDTAFSVNDWTAFVIFITVIGGIGRVEGPIIGTIVFFALRQTLADLGSLYLLMLGAVAIAVMLFAPKGIWGLLADRFGWQLLPLERRLRFTADARTT